MSKPANPNFMHLSAPAAFINGFVGEAGIFEGLLAFGTLVAHATVVSPYRLDTGKGQF